MFKHYEISEKYLDEVFQKSKPIQTYSALAKYFFAMSRKNYEIHNEYAKVSFFNQGITFAVYSDSTEGTERIFPFDMFPRFIEEHEWASLEKGVLQRNLALNMFIKDVYGKKKVLKDKIIPHELLYSSEYYLKEMDGFTPVGNIYTHISGTDLIKNSDNNFYVLEDNLRSPSGVSYVLTNRVAMKRIFSELFHSYDVESIEDYPAKLLETMQSVAPKGVDEPNCVLLTPGIYNSAYFEHTFLANKMGIELVEGRDLFVENNFVYMKTIDKPKRVDVIYRRLDDAFIDPLHFDHSSVIGVAGLMNSYLSGNVTIINAPGTGMADDKAVYSYVPDLIKYYLKEEPIIHNVPTFRCSIKSECDHVIKNLDSLVVKPVDASGGYGIFFGKGSTKKEQEEQKRKILSNPRKYIAQEEMALSTHPTYIESSKKFEPRHIDLRTFSLFGDSCSYVLRGGLTRVALKKGCLVVNSSQGGGSKDTWVLGDENAL